MATWAPSLLLPHNLPHPATTYLAFRKRFAPEYDLILNEYVLESYERTKALTVHTYSWRRTGIVPQAKMDEVALRGQRERGGGGVRSLSQLGFDRKVGRDGFLSCSQFSHVPKLALH